MKIAKRKGNSNVEIIMTMILLILFGVSIFTLIYAGSSTEKRIMAEKNIKINTRVAASYINVKIKQNDISGYVSVQPSPLGNGSAIFIKGDPATALDGDPANTWIYFNDGKLQEQLVTSTQPFQPDVGSDIATIDNFDVSQVNNSIIATFTYTYKDKQASLLDYISLRSKAD